MMAFLHFTTIPCKDNAASRHKTNNTVYILRNPGTVALERAVFKISNAERSESESSENEGRSVSSWGELSYRTSSGPAKLDYYA